MMCMNKEKTNMRKKNTTKKINNNTRPTINNHNNNTDDSNIHNPACCEKIAQYRPVVSF